MTIFDDIDDTITELKNLKILVSNITNHFDEAYDKCIDRGVPEEYIMIMTEEFLKE